MDATADPILIRGLIAAGVLVAVIGVAQLRSRRRDGFQPRAATLPRDALPDAAPLTAVYFTSRLCSECRETPGIVREASPDIPLVELAVHDRPDLVRAVGVFETPTLLLVDAKRRIRYARVGNPTPSELRFYIEEARMSAA